MRKTIFALTFIMISAVTFAQKIGIEIGNKAKDIELTGPDGKAYKMSDIKGKIVLLDFWAFHIFRQKFF